MQVCVSRVTGFSGSGSSLFWTRWLDVIGTRYICEVMWLLARTQTMYLSSASISRGGLAKLAGL